MTAFGFGPYPSTVPNARAKLARLKRQKPRWYAAGDERLWELARSGRAPRT